MNLLELTLRDTKKESIRLSKKIAESDFSPELIVFVGKGAFIIGKEISNYFDVPLVEIHAKREKNKIKDSLSFILKLIPKNIKKYLREKELNSNIHYKKSSRNVYLNNRYISKINQTKNVLIVDDSVDTGNTAKQVYDYINKCFNNKVIKFASINYFDKSKEIFEVDYTLYHNHIIIGPWSKDSRYYSEFLKRYHEWKKE